MNDGFALYLNMEPEESFKNERLLEKVDDLLETVGIQYAGFRNWYVPKEIKNRDDTVFDACRLLRDTDWLQGIFSRVLIMNEIRQGGLDSIKTDHMTWPSNSKLQYYEEYFLESKELAHSILVNEDGRIRDGYTSYLIAEKYGKPHPDIYEVFTDQPVQKVVRGRHVHRKEGCWKVKNSGYYGWFYNLRHPVVPGDILRVPTKKGTEYMVVEQISYNTGKKYCAEHLYAEKHMKERIRLER